MNAACICGQRDAEREPDANDRVIVPTAADCPVHGVSAASAFCRGGTQACEVCVGSCGIEEYERVKKQRDDLAARLMADPDRAATATLDGLRKLLPELKAEEDAACHAILDWIGVARDDLSLAERVRILALELATKQGYTLEEAERLAPTA